MMLPFAIPAILKRIPRGAWIALAVIAILALGTCAHKRSVKKFGDERYAAGVKAEGERIAKKAAEIKAKADAASSKITEHLRKKHDEKVVVITRSADTLRLSGAGKAACPRGPVVSGSPGRSEPASRGSDAAGPEVPSGDSAAVPWGWLVDRAEKCDLNRVEVLTWRDWYAKQSEAWAKIK